MLQKNVILFFSILFFFKVSQAQIEAEKFVLKENGLKVLLVTQKGSPTTSCQIFYNTGSVHETPGNTGITHLLEHMLFKGTHKTGITNSSLDSIFIPLIDSLWKDLQSSDSNLYPKNFKKAFKNYSKALNKYRSFFIKNELWNAYLQAGGTNLNAFTSNIITGYTVTLPKNKLDLFFWLESDRMQHAVLRDFYTERDVIMEERRMRYENSPYGLHFEKLKGLFYEAHPYRLPTIGYRSDIQNLSRKQAYQHYKKYYKPNNATLVLVGNFQIKPTIKKITQYFSSIPKGKKPPKITTIDPKPLGQKILITKTNKAKPRMDFWFKAPGFPNSELYALEVLSGILSGKSGRLYQHFVINKKLAISTHSYIQWQPTHSLFSISFQLTHSVNPEKVKKEFLLFLKKISEETMSKHEIQKVKNQIRAHTLNQLTMPEQLSTELAFYETMGNWNYINTIPEAINKISNQEIKIVLKKFIQPNNFTLGIVTKNEN